MKKILILTFFLVQIGIIGYQLTTKIKFFNWSMYHTSIRYTATVTINDVELDDKAFFERYRIKKTGAEGRSLEHLKRKMTQREHIYGDNTRVHIELQYTENTHKGSWTWEN